MNQIKKDLKAIAKVFKGLTQKTDRMIKQLKELEKPQATKEPKPKPARSKHKIPKKAPVPKTPVKGKTLKAKPVKKAIAKKPTKGSARDTVLAIIKRSRKGFDTPALKNKTGFKDTNIRTILYRLSKQGKIKRDLKGLYVKA